MDTNILIGPVISVALFLFIYRSTITAKKERANKAYNEITKMLFRNLVNDNHLPTITEIDRIIETKSLENKVNKDDLPNVMTFINDVYTKVEENEIISPDKKRKFVRKINNYIKKIDKTAPSVIEEEGEMPSEVEIGFSVLFFLSTIIAVIVVSIIVFLPEKMITMESLITLGFGVIAIIITLSTVSVFIKFREKLEETKVSRRSITTEYKKFENSIFEIIKDLGITTRDPKLVKDFRGYAPDFSVKRGQRTFLIEAKRLRSYLPIFRIGSLISQAKFAKKINKNYVLVLVVNDKKYLAQHLNLLKDVWDYIFDIDELRNFRNQLVHGR